MKQKNTILTIIIFVLAVLLAGSRYLSPTPQTQALSDEVEPYLGPMMGDASPPSEPVKLVFIHHSCGDNWLDDDNGNLGDQLGANNYYVSDTYYDWGPDSIGSNTDIGHWWTWFRGTNSYTYTQALYNTTNKHASYTRPMAEPGGENKIIMFKSCYPNSELRGDPTEAPPPIDSNPLRGQGVGANHTVANAKGIYIDLLNYFESHQDKLFVVITAPPVQDSTWADNARDFNTWLVEEWLDGYSYSNVVVFDFYNVLTDPDNHHRFRDGSVEYINDQGGNTLYYHSGGDNHPTAAGNQKATGEFVPLLNYYYNRWKSGGACQALSGASITGPANGYTNTLYAFTAGYTPSDASTPITYTWTPSPTAGSGAVVSYTWATTGTKNITLTAENCGGSATQPHTITIKIKGHYNIYLPLILKNYAPPANGGLVQPSDLVYQGAFRLPGGDTPPLTFAYGGNAMTFNPNGDPGSTDGFPGSLFITGHDRMACGELPNGSQVAEISIPAPVESGSLSELDQAEFLQEFHDVAAGYFTALEEIPRIGIEYLDAPATGPKIHLAWGQHFQDDITTTIASHAWFDPNLAAPNLQGTWFIGNQSLYNTNGYLFEIPTSWADEHAAGHYLGTGRYRDGGWGSMGPALFAYRPWIDISGTPAPSGTHLEETMLLLYESSENTENIERCLDGYQHPDEWEGGAWITTGSGKSAVLFAGTKGTGAKYWYGFTNPDGPEYPCVYQEDVEEYTVCRLADGTPCPAEDLTECEGHPDNRGWWSASFDAQFILYDPADLAQVAAGETDSWLPQPYDSLDLDEYLFLNPAGIEEDTLGTGVQRKYRIGAVAYDRDNDLLYVLELFADEAKPVVHVWKVQ